MWVAIKQAAGRRVGPASISLTEQELGDQDARHYRRLLGDFPSVERGPDESIASHYSRLKAALDEWRNEDPEIYKKRREDPQAGPRDDSGAKQPEWLTLRQREEAQRQPAPDKVDPGEDESEVEEQPPASDLPRRVPRDRPLAERDPGWYVSPESQSAGFGVPPMPRRTPGDTLTPSSGPGYAPDRQSIRDWVAWLHSKGIEVDHTLQVPNAARPGDKPYRTGPEIWQPFVDAPGYSGHQLVSSFVKRAISDRVHQGMLDAGWTFHGGHHPGQMGSWYQKTIGDRTHVIVKDDDWIHNSAPAGSKPNEFDELPVDQDPRGFSDLGKAVLHAELGEGIKGYAKPPTWHKMNSWEQR